jgi:organic radical activating enzyme
MSTKCNLNKACVLPFSHFNAYPMGDARACTMSGIFKDIDLNKVSIDEAFNSEEYKKLRSDMLNGIENDICKVCYNMESRDSESYRQKANNTYQKEYGLTVEDLVVDIKEDGYLKPNFIKLDIRPSNICNFKCRTCSSEYSTRWIEEEREYNLSNGREFDESMYKTIEKSYGISDDSIINLKEIYIAGGESLYMTEMYKFLEGIKDKSKITLHIHTNLSLLKFKKYDIFELLKDFNTVNFFISCDGIGEIGEYIRTGFNWETFTKNVDKLLIMEDVYPNFKHNFHFTSSILNIFHFFEFLEEIKKRKYVKTDSQIQFYPVRWPTYFNSINFNMKNEILEYYTSNINTIESIELKTQIQNFIDYVDKVDMEQDWQSIRNESGVDINAISTFKDMMDFGNKFNETNVPESLVYLKTILNPPKTFI